MNFLQKNRIGRNAYTNIKKNVVKTRFIVIFFVILPPI